MTSPAPVFSSRPKVSVGVPVRNGSATLARALDSVAAQTYPNIQVLISDNHSTDETPEIARRYCEANARFGYLRPDHPMGAWEHFRFVAKQADGDYFMWAADDDLRNDKYVEHLVDALESNLTAVLAFGDVIWFSTEEDLETSTPVTYEFEWEADLSYRRRVRKIVLSKCSEVYGLWRTWCLQQYSWIDTDYGPDLALLLYARMLGEFVHAPGAVISEWVPPSGDKSPEERAKENLYRAIKPLRVARLAVCCTRAAVEASSITGIRTSRVGTFLTVYLIVRNNRTKLWLYGRLPKPAVRLWRWYKGDSSAEPATLGALARRLVSSTRQGAREAPVPPGLGARAPGSRPARTGA